jgi:hypothetical protein
MPAPSSAPPPAAAGREVDRLVRQVLDELVVVSSRLLATPQLLGRADPSEVAKQMQIMADTLDDALDFLDTVRFGGSEPLSSHPELPMEP